MQKKKTANNDIHWSATVPATNNRNKDNSLHGLASSVCRAWVSSFAIRYSLNGKLLEDVSINSLKVTRTDSMPQH